MSLQYSRADEKFSEAIEILIISPKDIRHRLYEASEILLNLEDFDIPQESLNNWHEIKTILKKVKVHKINNKTSIIEKKLNIRNKTGSKIASKILDIYEKIQYLREEC